MTDEFAEAARRIESNPLGRLMYGQRELFHSNLLAWFFDYLPEVADAVFRPLTAEGEDSSRWVERERENLDLVMHWPDRAPLVIENKVFSVPSAGQLAEYSRRVGRWNHAPAKRLLAPAAPGFDMGDWEFLSYGELADAIESALPESDTSYAVETMRHYALLARDLSSLVAAIEIQTDEEAVWLSAQLLSAISSSQMRSALNKARAARVARHLTLELPDLFNVREFRFDLRNATPLVDWNEPAPVNDLKVWLGWQFQGSQLRRTAVYTAAHLDNRSDQALAEREAISKAHPEFFTFPDWLPVSVTSRQRKEFGHFRPSFVYKWVATPELTITDLARFARWVHEDVAGISG